MTYKINLIYPAHQQKLFTDRKSELELLTKRTISSAEPMHAAVIGLRKIGKTILIKEFIKRHKTTKFVYINVEEIITSPEVFAIKVAGKCISWVFGGEELALLSYQGLVQYNLSLKSGSLTSFLSKYNEYISRSHRDYGLFLLLLFEFFENLAAELRQRLIIIFDEFQAALTLDRYRNLHFLKLFRKYVENAHNVSYLISGSAVTLMKESLGDHSPLFQLFSEIDLSFLPREDSFLFIKKILKNIETEQQSFMYYLTRGHPFYLYWLSKDLETEKIDELAIKTMLIQQVLSKEKQIYKHCHYLYKISLQQAKGYNNLKLVLQTLSQNEGISINELTKLTNKVRPAIGDAVDELLKVDLLKLDEQKRIWFIDPVFKLWVSYYELGIEIADFTIKKTLLELLQDLDKKYQLACSELGKAKEYEWKVKLEKKFGLKLENYHRGNIELDLVGRKGKVRYVFEVKHRNKPANYKDIKMFLDKVGESEFAEMKKKLFFISKSGFTREAEKKAKEEGIELIF